jgi:hypothetical protein
MRNTQLQPTDEATAWVEAAEYWRFSGRAVDGLHVCIETRNRLLKRAVVWWVGIVVDTISRVGGNQPSR